MQFPPRIPLPADAETDGRALPLDVDRATSAGPSLPVLAALALVAPLAEWLLLPLLGYPQGFNDFHDYYLAAKLVAEGQSPYNLAALADIARREGLTFVIGTGYSYPLPFAVAMLPFTLVPFTPAVLGFTVIGLAVFGASVAIGLRWAFPAAPAERVALAALVAGAYPPVYGTLANGQANFVVFALLAVGVGLALARRADRQVSGGVAIGLAAIVKLVPGIVVVPLALGSRWRPAIALIAAVMASSLVASFVAPWANEGSHGLVALLGPDSYFTNQSLNGFISRLVRDSDRTLALFPGLFDPVPVAAAAACGFALVNATILLRARPRLGDRRALGVALGLAIVAAAIGAPKNSFWNQVALLVPVGLLLAATAPNLQLRRVLRSEVVLLAVWLAGSVVQLLLWVRPPGKDGPLAPAVTLAQSAALYGALALWWLFARRVWRGSGEAPGG